MGNVMVNEMYVYFSTFYPKKHDSYIYISHIFTSPSLSAFLVVALTVTFINKKEG